MGEEGSKGAAGVAERGRDENWSPRENGAHELSGKSERSSGALGQVVTNTDEGGDFVSRSDRSARGKGFKQGDLRSDESIAQTPMQVSRAHAKGNTLRTYEKYCQERERMLKTKQDRNVHGVASSRTSISPVGNLERSQRPNAGPLA